MMTARHLVSPMKKRPLPPVTAAELKVLEELWQRGPSTIRDLRDMLYPQGGESKFATLQDLQTMSPAWVASSFLLESGSARERALEQIIERGELAFPLVLKPDVAQRGSGFKVIRSLPEAHAYLAGVPVSVVAQQYIPGPREAGKVLAG